MEGRDGRRTKKRRSKCSAVFTELKMSLKRLESNITHLCLIANIYKYYNIKEHGTMRMYQRNLIKFRIFRIPSSGK